MTTTSTLVAAQLFTEAITVKASVNNTQRRPRQRMQSTYAFTLFGCAALYTDRVRIHILPPYGLGGS